MTRVTNFGRKRTYVQAGFDNEPQASTASNDTSTQNQDANAPQYIGDEPETKKRKRVRSKKTKFADADATAADGQSKGGDMAEGEEGAERDGEAAERRSKKSKFGDKGKHVNKFDKRRQKGDVHFT